MFTLAAVKDHFRPLGSTDGEPGGAENLFDSDRLQRREQSERQKVFGMKSKNEFLFSGRAPDQVAIRDG